MQNNNTNITARYLVSATAISIVNVSLFSTVTLLTALFLCLRRNHQFIRARNVGVAFFSLFFYFVTFSINSLFYAVSPERFPCWLHFFIFAFAPLAVVGSIIKSWRLLFLMLLARAKTELASGTCNHVQRTTRAIKVYGFLTSIPFLIIVLLIVAIIHIPLFIINITLLPFNYRCDITNPLLQNFLYAEAVIPLCVYCLIYSGMAIILFFAKLRDTWSIRCEIYVSPLYWFPLALVYAIMILNLDTVWPEPYVPVSLFVWLGAYIDVFINMWIPVLRSFLKNATTEPKDLRETLKDKQLRKGFLQFATRSFCPESVLFWIDVHEHFVNQPADMKQAFLQQVSSKYLLSSSMYELNLDAKIKNQVVTKVQNALAKKELEDDLLRELIVHVEIDLQETFSRYIATRK